VHGVEHPALLDPEAGQRRVDASRIGQRQRKLLD
jgi:hypothetical protein